MASLHTVTQEVIREALDPTTTSGRPHPEEYVRPMNIFYTSDTELESGRALGTIGLVMSIDGCSMWRFGDELDGGVDVSAVRRWKTDVW